MEEQESLSTNNIDLILVGTQMQDMPLILEI